jgi:hypothetical protein
MLRAREHGIQRRLASKDAMRGPALPDLQDLNPQRLPKFVSMESASPDLITLMAGRRFKR